MPGKFQVSNTGSQMIKHRKLCSIHKSDALDGCHNRSPAAILPRVEQPATRQCTTRSGGSDAGTELQLAARKTASLRCRVWLD